ncbi:uncharacterized protein LOC120330832 [Styela clava]
MSKINFTSNRFIFEKSTGMGNITRSVKSCARSRSMQPFWIGTIVITFLVCHLIFDARKLLMMHFQGSQITINVANYNLQEIQGDEAILFNQVKSGEKPIFVLEDDHLASKLSLKQRNRHGWNKATLSFYPKLYTYQNFAELPAFSTANCRRSLNTFIPNIVHFIWFGKLEMTFLQYLSVRSAATVQRPSLIILHTDSGEPTGKYWESLKNEIPCLEVRFMAKPTKIFGKYPLTNVKEQSHVSRLQVLFEEGGIYANLNVIFVKPFDELMNKSLVLGKEENQYYSNSVILAERGASFITMWFTAYNRKLVDWSTYSIYIPWRLHRENPGVPIHIEEYSMMRPNFNEDEWITHNNWVLDENYCVHLYDDRSRIKTAISQSPVEIINMDNTLGQLTRLSLFGKKYLELEEENFRSTVHSKIDCSKPPISIKGFVPNIIHYILKDEGFTYIHYLSFRSAVRKLEPWAVHVHLVQNKEPDNYYWIRTLTEIGCITIHQPTGRVLFTNATKSERNIAVTKLIQRVLHEYGGIYLSYDVIVTSTFEDLLKNHVVMGTDTAYTEDVKVLLSSPNSRFLSEWFSWNKNDVISIKRKIEQYTDNHPREHIVIVGNFPAVSPAKGWISINFDYVNIKCFAVLERDTKVKLDEDTMYNLLRSNSLTGEIARIAHFGKQRLDDSFKELANNK